MEARYAELVEHLNAIADLERVSGLLGWDQQAAMPPGGGAARAHQRATLRRLAHRLFTDDEIGALLDDLEPWARELPYESDEASLIRVVRREFDRERRVPTELAAELSAAASRAHESWVAARAESSFDAFRPSLEEAIRLRRAYVACFEPAAEPYDLLLEDYEPGMTTADVETLFARMCERLVPLIAEASRRDAAGDPLHGRFSTDAQERLIRDLLGHLGFEPTTWRLDTVVHPFAIAMAPSDVRITTRYDEQYLATALFGALHEFGHGLYEAGVPTRLDRTPIGRLTSLGLHESQSRMWENLVGRSLPFWRRFVGDVRDAFPEALGGVTAESFHQAVNRVEPSLIRVEADEATYNLHIVIRFELERALISGALDVADLPVAWNDRMRDYLGIRVPDDAHGVLQDPHWCFGFGYFPTYSLGNMASAQLWRRLTADIPDLDAQIERGEFAPLREWLRGSLHALGSKLTLQEALERIVGERLTPEPYLDYLDAKFGNAA